VDLNSCAAASGVFFYLRVEQYLALLSHSHPKYKCKMATRKRPHDKLQLYWRTKVAEREPFTLSPFSSIKSNISQAKRIKRQGMIEFTGKMPVYGTAFTLCNPSPPL
jgi:hypothetical protein